MTGKIPSGAVPNNNKRSESSMRRMGKRNGDDVRVISTPKKKKK